MFWFSRKREVEQGAFVHKAAVLFRRRDSQQEVMLASEIPLKGAHNLENALAAVCAGALMGCEDATIGNAIRNFKGAMKDGEQAPSQPAQPVDKK